MSYECGKYFLKGETLLNFELKNKKIEKIIFTGVNRNCCVKETAKEAKNKGYEIYAAKDLMNNYIKKDWFTKNSKYFENHKELINHFVKKDFIGKLNNNLYLSPKNSH